MQRKVIKLLATLGIAAAAIVGSATKADAAFIAYICNDATCSGGDDIQVVDNANDGIGGNPDDGSPITGFIVLSATYLGYEIVVNQSQSKPVLANGMDLQYTVTNSNETDPATGTIYLFASDTGFVGSGTATGSLGGTNPETATTTSVYICDGDATDNFSPCSSNSFFGAGAFTLGVTRPITTNPFALTIGVSIANVPPGQTATGDFRVTVPEPTTMGLFGLALFGLGGAVRRRFVN